MTIRSKYPAGAKRAGYLTAAVLCAIVALTSLGPAVPLFLKLFVPFPKLENSNHLKGKVNVVGAITFGPKGSVTGPKFFISDGSTTTEFKFGLYGNRNEPLDWPHFDNAEGSVWYHPLFGVLQWDLAATQGVRKGSRLQRPYSIAVDHFEKNFNYSRASSRLVIPFFFIGLAIYLTRRAVAQRATNQDQHQS